jgi:LysM repeat protein
VIALVLMLASPVTAQTDSLPEAAYVSGLIGHPQGYNLSCESRSAADWAAYWGVSVGESEFLGRLPRSDNPDLGFVGNPHGYWGNIPPYPYGVHAEPVAALLREYGLPAQAHRGLNWDDLRAEIAAGRPVIVWVIGQMWPGTPVVYTAVDGSSTTVARYEHTMILVGYSAQTVHVLDASSGRQGTFPLSQFLTSWGVLGNLAVTGTTGPTFGPEGEWDSTYTVRPGDYLTDLARRFGIPWEALAAHNGIPYPYVIHPGQILHLPGDPLAASPTPTPRPAPLPTATLAGMRAEDEGAWYIVQAGEYLQEIAEAMGVDWLELARINELASPFILFPGQNLRLPPDPTGTPTPTPAATPAAAATSAPTLTPSPGVTPEPSPARMYTVQRGDYLLAIAMGFEVDWRVLADINGVVYPYAVYPGQNLVIP